MTWCFLFLFLKDSDPQGVTEDILIKNGCDKSHPRFQFHTITLLTALWFLHTHRSWYSTSFLYIMIDVIFLKKIEENKCLDLTTSSYK